MTKYYNDDLKYIKDKRLREQLKDTTKNVVCVNKGFVIEESSEETNEEDMNEQAEDPYPYIEELYHELQTFTQENGLCLLDKCSITEFIEFIR